MSDRTTPNTSQPPKAACVVWCPAATKAPAGLMHALQSKGLTTTTVTHGYAAMASVLRQGVRGGVVVLVAVEPDRHDRYDEVNAALDRYAPRTARWTFVAGDQPPLQVARGVARKAVERSPIQAPERSETKLEPSGESRRSTNPPAGPMLRLTGLGVLDVLDHETDDSSDGDGASLTSEEMAALLADDPHEGRHS